jgi:hypothetical protein
MSSVKYRSWKINVRKGEVIPWSSVTQDVEQVEVIDKAAYDELASKMTELKQHVDKLINYKKELSEQLARQDVQIKQKEGMSLEEMFFNAGIGRPTRR